MGTRPYITFDPLLPESDAASLSQVCQDVGEYGMYSDERADAAFGTALPERYHVFRWFEVTGGDFGRPKPPETLTPETRWQRTSGTLFRRTYAYGNDVYDPGIESYLHNEHLIAAARGIHGRPLVVPAIVYGNIMVPGQEVPLHVDVPEFQGADRRVIPQWLLNRDGPVGVVRRVAPRHRNRRVLVPRL